MMAEQPSARRVEDGHVEVVRALLQHDKVDVNLQDNDGSNSTLARRVEDGHVEVVRALLQHDKVDVNLQDDDGTTALWHGES
jgi:ankyrin repeat protein